MERKPQQQTLSIRIPDSLRGFLDRVQQVISNGAPEPVSISEVAKTLLESVKVDRLDFRLEAAYLMLAPTHSLGSIRRKWESGQPLSRAEWILLGHYIQAAVEELSENPALPSPSAFAVVLKSILAVRSLRTDRGVGLDRYYLGNLGFQRGVVFNDRQFDPHIVPQARGRANSRIEWSVHRPEARFCRPQPLRSLEGRDAARHGRDERCLETVPRAPVSLGRSGTLATRAPSSAE